MYLLCSDWSIRSLEKEKKEEEKEEEENCHLLITASCTNEGRDKNITFHTGTPSMSLVEQTIVKEIVPCFTILSMNTCLGLARDIQVTF